MSERLPASSMPTLRQLQFLTAIRAEGSFVAARRAHAAFPISPRGLKASATTMITKVKTTL